MQCKNCTKGQVLRKVERTLDEETLKKLGLEGPVIGLDAASCDCCGGYYEDCENCAAGKRIIQWVDDETGDV